MLTHSDSWAQLRRRRSLSARFLRWARRVRERVETAVAWLFVLAVAAGAVALWAWLLLAEGEGMNKWNKQDAKCIERELREAFPGEKFKVQFDPFNVRVENDRLDPRKVRRVVDQWFAAAYGTKVKWGRLQRLTQ